MKRNAIARIVIYTVAVLVMTAILIVGIAPEYFMYTFGDHSATDFPKEGRAPATVRRLEIDWAGGTVTIQKGSGTDIWFYESAPDGCWYHMDYDYNEYTLQIQYGKSSFIGLGKVPEKNLVIQVPENWNCEDLVINGAGLEVYVDAVDVENLKMNGAGCNLDFSGAITQLNADGAGAALKLHCTNKPEYIRIDGMGCSIDLTLPQECGFSVKTSGMGCELVTELPWHEADGYMVYGNSLCSININGLGCQVKITETKD